MKVHRTLKGCGIEHTHGIDQGDEVAPAWLSEDGRDKQECKWAR